MSRLNLPPFTPHPGQEAILNGVRLRNVACMGRRFGKTHLMTEVILNGKKNGALAARKPTAWYAPNDSYFAKVYQGIVSQYMPVIKRAATMPRPHIEFKTGGSIDFWTLENPMKCGRGNYYARVVIDEAAHARHLQEAWENTIEYTLADLNGDAWFISTPYGRNYFFDLWQNGNPDNPKRKTDWISHTAPSMDNPYLPAGWMEGKRTESPERVFAQEVLAQFLQEGAGVFRRVTDAVDYALPTDPYKATDAQDGSAYVIGVDWGRHNDFTVFVTIDARAGAVVALDRFTDIDYSFQLGKLKALHQRFPRAPILAESNSMGGPLIEQLQRMQLPVRSFNTTAASKVEAIEALALAFENGVLRIPKVEWFVNELMAFDQERLPSGTMRYCAPRGGHDDGVMALAICYSGVAYAANPYKRTMMVSGI
jgi:phage FluMu gp28-like protein